GYAPPLPAGRQNVENGIHHRPQINFAGPPDTTSRRQKKRQQKPFRIPRITCIAAATTPILLTGGFSPNHCDLHRIFANPTESQRAEITPPIFGQALRCERKRASKDERPRCPGRRPSRPARCAGASG